MDKREKMKLKEKLLLESKTPKASNKKEIPKKVTSKKEVVKETPKKSKLE
tara:strand:+ start:1704 stop:1853 length:150 start_codon:yes stop_codon:yes gene_type:complete